MTVVNVQRPRRDGARHAPAALFGAAEAGDARGDLPSAGRRTNFTSRCSASFLKKFARWAPWTQSNCYSFCPTRITNRGFPDFELRGSAEPKLVSEEQIEKIFQSSLRLMDVESLSE